MVIVMTKRINIKNLIFTVIYVILTLFALVQASLPAAQSTAVSNFFTEFTLFGQEITEVKIFTKVLTFEEFASFLRKFVGHFGLFAMMGAVGFFALYRGSHVKKTLIIDLSVTFFIASLTETIQFFVPSRAGLLSDIVLDTQGAIMSAAVTAAVLCAIRKAHDKPSANVFPLLAILSILFAILFVILNTDDFYTYFCFTTYLFFCALSLITLLLTDR